MPIKVLRPELAAQIAAGEVVERPASVVKELLENSLDAGASQIIVEIKGGGVEQLRVTDDGQGIPADEVEVAFMHHATSKLESAEQLDAIATLGFRGEALPSIAAVSHLTMTTRPHEISAGHQIELQWGKRVRVGSRGCPPGTSVTVSDLFGNLPARRKFLKSTSSEATRVQELVSHYALAYAHIRFQLIVDGKTVLTTPGNGKAPEALLAVYSRELAAGMLEVYGEDPETGYRVDGFVSAPSLNRANRTYLTFFVNRRWIQNRLLSFALEEAYHGLLPEKRYPLAVINLSIPYADVDVNSHPSKRDVRFRHEGKVYSTLQRAVRPVLVADSPVPEVRLSDEAAAQLKPVAAAPSFFPASGFTVGRGEIPPSPPSRKGGEGGPPDAAGPRQVLPGLRVVGQIRRTYIVAEGPDGMYLMDQHAAHERVLFDRICRHASLKSPPSQPLLEPVTVELTLRQAEVLHNSGESLASYGFEVEPFGEKSYLVRAVPSILTSQDPGQSLLAVLDMVAFEGLLRQKEDILAASIACHSAIRAGMALTEGEMRALLEQLEATDNPHSCPHGRPTMIHLSSYHMEREFGRR